MQTESSNLLNCFGFIKRIQKRYVVGVLLVSLAVFLVTFIRFILVQKVKNKTTTPLPSSEAGLAEAEVFRPLVIGWIPYWDQERAVASFRRNVDVFDYVSLFWYQLDKVGTIRKYDETIEDEEIIDFAHENEVKVFAVIANLPDFTEGGDWDWRRVDKVISTPEARKNHIQALFELIESKNLDGLDIDYEALQRGQREDFTAFIEELAEFLHGKGKILGVAIHPKTSENNPTEANGSQAQDLVRLSKAVDHLYFMTYEEHYELSAPGPVGSLGWMESVLGYAIDESGVLREKVFVGIPLYGYDWTEKSSTKARGLEFDEVTRLIERFHPKINWKTQAGESSFSYTKNDLVHTVWFNDKKSVEAKLEIAKKYSVGGIAFWRLGGEDTNVWNLVSERKGKY